ncbi:kinase-like domain-containing protein [Chaetomium tenue]|uniref:Kinase-like domain-containing protein n=1 Tax=Chaetomium tenue TaxID=1854479 RepID=A0ACB7P7B1_9PEZI|nr:kinase-like domain-containing protein [Chaetomium globosum]
MDELPCSSHTYALLPANAWPKLPPTLLSSLLTRQRLVCHLSPLLSILKSLTGRETFKSNMATEKRPNITDLEDLQIHRFYNSEIGHYVEWFHYTADDEAYRGFLHKDRRDITLDEFATGLKRMSDEVIFPEVPTDPEITITPKNLDGSTVHIKRPGLKHYRDFEEEAECATKDQVLIEALAIEKISKTPHPYVVRYHGCTVHRGRITGIAMERLGETLSHYAHCSGGCISEHKTMFDQIDKQAFLAGVESAVKFLHSLGLAHNDINPRNIMVREASDGAAGGCTPVLIDFDSCGPFGTRMQSFGTPGFMDTEDEEMVFSQKKHDDFSLKRLAEWWDADSDSKDNWGNTSKSSPETPKAD